MMRVVFALFFLGGVLVAGCVKEKEEVMSLRVSSIFQDGERIPAKYTCEGEDVSPPLKIEDIDSKAMSIAIIVDDPDAPIGTFTHWVAWNIPPVDEIPENIPKKEVVESPVKMYQGRNDFGRIGYNGPCPPRGHGLHHYHFKVFVLDTVLDLKPGSGKRDLEKAMEGHVIQMGELVGVYERR